MDQKKDAQFYLQCARRIPKKISNIQGKRNVLCSRGLLLSLKNPFDIYDIWGMHLLNSMEYSKSEKKLKKALIFDAYKANTWEDLGKAKLALGEDEEGLRCLKIAMSISPSDFLHKALIKALYERGRVNEIPEIYKELVEIIPVGTNRGSFYYAASLVLQDLGLFSLALSFFRIIMGFFPHVASFHIQFGELLRKEGLLQEATDAFRKAVEYEYSYFNLTIDIAMLLFHQGKVQDAIKELEAARDTPQIADSVLFYLVFMRSYLSEDQNEVEKERDELMRVLESGNNKPYEQLSQELKETRLKIENPAGQNSKDLIERKIKALNSVLAWVEEYHGQNN